MASVNALVLGESGVVKLGVSGVKLAAVQGAVAIVQLIGWPTVEDVRWLNPRTGSYQPWPDPTPGKYMYYWYDTETGSIYHVDPMPKDAPLAWGPYGMVYPYPPGLYGPPETWGHMGEIVVEPGKWMTRNVAGGIQDLDLAVCSWRYKNLDGTTGGPLAAGYGDLLPVRTRIYGPARGVVVNGARPEVGADPATAPLSVERLVLGAGEFYELAPKYAPPAYLYDGKLWTSRSEAWFFPQRTDVDNPWSYGPVPRWSTWPWN